jgi:NADPH:quinone reductase-like Zn-dependent oxidoreductase
MERPRTGVDPWAGCGADLVLDMGGASTIERSVKAMAYSGILALVGGMGSGGIDYCVPAMSLMSKSANVRGVDVGTRAGFLRMTKFLVQHKIHPLIDRTYTLDVVDTALKDLEAMNFVGKLVIRL